jgi:hypothetical protein
MAASPFTGRCHLTPGGILIDFGAFTAMALDGGGLAPLVMEDSETR